MAVPSGRHHWAESRKSLFARWMQIPDLRFAAEGIARIVIRDLARPGRSFRLGRIYRQRRERRKKTGALARPGVPLTLLGLRRRRQPTRARITGCRSIS